jgi:multiple sugar transport system permease protein
MPKELEEAAHIDGAGPIKTFLRVMAPNAAPAFITVMLFSTVWYWSDYFYAGTLLADVGSTVSVRLSQLTTILISLNGFRYDPVKFTLYMQAGSLLTIAPPLLLFVIFQRYFVESVERSGIVG